MEINYQLHDNQLRVFNDPARFKVLTAGRRFGKTILSIVSIITKSLQKNKSRCWYLAPTYRQAKMIAWKLLVDYLPKELINKKNEVDLEITLINGSEIALKGAENEDSLKGIGLDFAVLDEYAFMKPNVWQEIIRPMLTDTKGEALFISTPKGKNSFFDLFLKGQRKEDGYSSYRFKTIDNPFIDPKEVEEAKTQLSEVYFRQEYEASFEDYTGLIWPEFNKSHIVAPFVIPDNYNRVCVIDPAISGTTAAIFSAIDEDGRVIVYDEYYQQDSRVSESATEIINKGKVGRYIIDPASKSNNIQKEGKLYSLYNEFAEYGINAIAGENDVEAGINRVGEYFKLNNIKIFSTCKNLIYELERYHWSEEKETSNGILTPKPYKHLDHACDCLRYLCMSRPRKTEIKQPEVPANSVWGRYLAEQNKHEGFIYGR